jgi:hypothetical protein
VAADRLASALGMALAEEAEKEKHPKPADHAETD